MIRMDKNMKKIFYILSAAVVMATACTRETLPEQESVLTTTVAPAEGDMMCVTFNLSVPESNDPPVLTFGNSTTSNDAS